jgi:ribonuclease R
LNDTDFRPADDSGIPVPSRHLIIGYLTREGAPVSLKKLWRHFDLQGKAARQALESRLERLQRQGVVIIDRRGRLALPDKMGAFIGRVIGHPNGFGFVRPDEGGDDLYLHHRQMRKVLHGDRVVAKLKDIDSRGRREGAIVEVIVDSGREIVGHFHVEEGIGFVEPDDARFAREIVIPDEGFGPAQDGDIVVIEIVRHPVQHHHAVGRVKHVLGNELAPGMETEIAIRKHEIPASWPEAVESQLEKERRRLTAARMDRSREDIRDLALVTIDGADARDFDDAVYCERNRRGWRLVVAIADVSHYVRLDSSIDREAYSRGNSVYFPNRVVPMLPELLSNGTCSLNPGVDRCCMVCDMQISRAGNVVDYEFYPGLMHSRARLTYDAVSRIVSDRDAAARSEWAAVCDDLDNLHQLYQLFARQRERRGTINFEFPEPLIHFDDNQRIDRITIRERNVAHRMIEECMLAANVCAGELIRDYFGDAGLYRNHEGPDADALADLRAFLKSIGLHLAGDDDPDASDYAALLRQSAARPAIAGVTQTVLLRSLSQAVYATEPLGHFALSYPVYTHFTSPIRRYPDLIVHRLIRRIISDKQRRITPDGVSMAELGEHCSFTERRAEDAVRDVIGWLKAEYMQDRIDEEFDGVISGVKEFGIFVQLDDVFVDGLVHVTALGSDYYRYDPLNLTLQGDRSGRRFRLGDRLRIRVARVDLDLARIDFELASANTDDQAPRRRSRKKRADSRRHNSGQGKRKHGKKGKIR